MITDLGLSLKPPFLSKPLHANTFVKALSDKNQHIIRRLSYVANEIKDIEHVLELDAAELLGLRLWCKVRTECAWIGDARKQIQPFVFMQPELRKEPIYVITAGLRRINNNEQLFDFEYQTRDAGTVRQVCNELKTHLNSLI